ncbi:hypothetical protein B5800_06925 [Gilliamella apicola]|nr:hypothetical protein A9G14_00360 [Gilliamella apicola]ORF45540.1 hypothetical protein B5800_06925 [Gilliamella apicola]ORF47439.1 hypothetical protein B5799_12585 [Gilliamella apicola]ORF51163.1 hypothetical protein B5803_07775 [Gilliamella apicola]ORF52115.1 hypothetical protein B5798_12355 [Gilliamella apicola]
MVKLLKISKIDLLENIESTLKIKLEKLGPKGLYLDKCATVSGYFSPSITVMILSMEHDKQQIKAKIAVLFTEIEPAYCCPMISSEHHGICDMQVIIDMATGEIFI